MLNVHLENAVISRGEKGVKGVKREFYTQNMRLQIRCNLWGGNDIPKSVDFLGIIKLVNWVEKEIGV